MDTSLKWAFWTALTSGLLLSVYITTTVFIPFSYSSWLTFHNTLVIASFIGAFLVGHKYRLAKKTGKRLFAGLTLYFIMIMFLYLSSYTLTTGLLSDKMKWIPFFYRDYEYHAFRSVYEYLDHSTNFKDLLVLQVVSLLISSILYFIAGIFGYFINCPVK